MSEDSIPVAADTAPAEPSAPAKSARRVSNPRPKKTAKKVAAESAPEPQAASESAPVAETPVAPAPAPVREEAPVNQESSRREEREEREEGGNRTPWAEPETIQGETGSQGGKRKRRRKKKGGNAHAHPNESPAPRAQAPGSEGTSLQAPARPAQPQPAPQQAPRVPLDLEEVSKKAWKIFLSEVSEEGLALIGDNDARDLTRRSFRLAEIFLEEKARRNR